MVNEPGRVRPYLPSDYKHLVAIDPSIEHIDLTKLKILVDVPFGYIGYTKSKEEKQDEKILVATIHRWRVKPEFRGQGIGTKLVDSIKANKLVLVVNEESEYLNWLLGRGFLSVGLRRGAFGKRDGIIFERVND